MSNLARDFAAAPDDDSVKVFKAGLVMLRNDNVQEAVLAFEHALRLAPDEPFTLSYLGLSMAMIRRRVHEAMAFCERAVQTEQYHPELYCNLGRVYLMSGNRQKARQAFHRGLELDPKNDEIHEQLRRMGIRKPPPLSFLPRDNQINVVLGKTLRRLRLR
jgi:Flp pilus assembly protein TadD